MSDDAFRDPAGQLRTPRTNRRKFLQGAAALGAAATGVFTGARVIVPVRAQDAVKVTFWTEHTDPDLTIMKSMVETYNAQAKGHQVELVQIPPAQVTDNTKLLTAVRGGTGPDVYNLDRFIVASRAADGALQDLTELMGGQNYLSNYISFAQQEATFAGKPYALPWDTDARVLYYNKKMIQDAGVDPAELDPAKGPVTWDRVKEISDKINKQDGSGNFTQMGFIPWLNQGWHYTYGFSYGGTFFDQTKCEVSPDDAPIVTAFQWVQDYCKALGADKVSAFGSPSMVSGADPAQHPFHTKTLAMQITGDWEIAQLAKYAPDIDYGITWMPVPKAGDKSVTWAGGWSVVIPQGAKHPKEGFAFMQWFAGEPGQRIYTQQSSHLPTWKSLLSDSALFEQRHQFFTQILPTAKNRPPLPVGAKYWDELTVAWQKTYLDQGKPADLLKNVRDRVDGDLKQFCPVTIAAPTS